MGNYNGVRRKKRRKIKKSAVSTYGRKTRKPGRRGISGLNLLVLTHRAKKMIITVGITVILIAAGYFVNKTYTVRNVYVDGNVHYTDQEIANIVTSGKLGKSTIYLFFKYRNKEINDVPFIETMNIAIEKPDTIRVTVYEKSLAGYVEYLGRYMYFDKDGVVAEVSDKAISGIPEVDGLKFDHVVLYEQLPVSDKKIFSEILSITHLLSKYQLNADKIYFDDKYDVKLYFGGVEVDLGQGSDIDDKVTVLPEILEKLKGKEGILDLTEYKDGDTITFTSENK